MELKNVTLDNLAKVKRVFLNKQTIAKIDFKKEEWVVYTFDSTTQNSIAAYLNSKNWDNKMETINYYNKEYTCFPVISLEMINWLKTNTKEFPALLFHRTKKASWKGPWMRLRETSIVK